MSMTCKLLEQSSKNSQNDDSDFVVRLHFTFDSTHITALSRLVRFLLYSPPLLPGGKNRLLYQLRICCYSCFICFISVICAVVSLNNRQTTYSFAMCSLFSSNHICSYGICCLYCFFFLLTLSPSICLRSSYIPPAAIDEVLTKQKYSVKTQTCSHTDIFAHQFVLIRVCAWVFDLEFQM